MKHLFLCSHPRSGTALFLQLINECQPVGLKIHSLRGGAFRKGQLKQEPIKSILGADLHHFYIANRLNNVGPTYCEELNPQFNPEIFTRSIAKLYEQMCENHYISLKWFPGEFKLLLELMGTNEQGSLVEQLQPIFGDIAFVRLRRHDIVRQAVSHYISQETGVTHKREQMMQRTQGLAYDFDIIFRNYQNIHINNTRWDELFAHYGLSPLELTFEDMIADSNAVIEPLKAYLGVELAVPRGEDMTTESVSLPLNDDFAERFTADLAALNSGRELIIETLPTQATTRISP